MWVIRGPFDGDEGQDLSIEKSKLLKPGKRYILGRKDTDLLIHSKRISREHVSFTVSEFPTFHIDDPTFRPKVRLQNPRNKTITMQRGDNVVTLDPSSSTDLLDGDAIHLVGSITVVISWYPVCCRSSATVATDKGSCANIGVHVVHSSRPEVTHTITQELVLTPSCVLSLLGSEVVTPEWLAEVIHRGTDGNGSSALEQHFELPDTSSYLPAVSAALPSTLSSTDFWTNSASRRGILSDYRFVIFIRDSKSVEDLQSAISLSGGGYELFPVGSGRLRLHRRLSADKDKRKKVIVVDEEARSSVTSDSWNELIDEAKTFEPTFRSREQVLEAIIVGKPSLLDHLTVSTEVSPRLHRRNLLPEHTESSLRSGRLTRRTTPSAPPPFDRERSLEVEPPQVQRVLTRRVKAGSVPPTVDDSGTMDGNRFTGEDSAPIGIDMDIPLLPRPSRPLKRRAGTVAPESLLQTINESGTPTVEPPLKKFKSLFEESDPDRLSLNLPQENSEITQESHPRSSPMLTGGEPGQGARPSVIEGDEVSEHFTVVESRGRKRRVDTEDAEDILLTSALTEQEIFARPFKRRVVETDPGSVGDTDSQTHEGAKLGEPDTDKRFLTALASMKKGRKNEDTFDREFNNLRISKPDIEREAIEQEWDLLDGLDDERNVRGNFMLVMELAVHKKGGTGGTGALGVNRIDWEGKANFKKFRKKNDARRRPTVELVMSQGNDYGVGPAYWKDDPDSAQADEFLGHSQALSRTRALQLPNEDSDDEDHFPVKPQTKTSARSTEGVVRGPAEEISEPLFLSSEDEDVGVTKHGGGDDRDEGTETLRSAGSSRKSRVRQGQVQHVAYAVDNDDSDDGTTFRGFGTKSKPSRRR